MTSQDSHIGRVSVIIHLLMRASSISQIEHFQSSLWSSQKTCWVTLVEIWRMESWVSFKYFIQQFGQYVETVPFGSSKDIVYRIHWVDWSQSTENAMSHVNKPTIESCVFQNYLRGSCTSRDSFCMFQFTTCTISIFKKMKYISHHNRLTSNSQ